MISKILSAFLINLPLSAVFVFYCYVLTKSSMSGKFWIRLFGLAAVMTCIHLVSPNNLPLKQYPLRFLFMIFIMRMPWDSSLIALFLFYFMTDPMKRDAVLISNHYWGENIVLNPALDGRVIAIFLLLGVCGCGLVFLTRKWLSKIMSCHLSGKTFVMLCGYCVLMSVVYFVAGTNIDSSRIAILINCIGISCVFALLAFFEYQNQKRLETERALVEQAIQFENGKIMARQEYSDILMHRLHDFKKELPHLLQTQELKEEVSEISGLIESFDRIYNTGNSYLDSVLNDKAVVCQENHIQLLCILDGHLFDFMRPADLISLFANALDNAIEAVMKIDGNEACIIQVKANITNGFLYLSFQNPYQGELKMGADGPLSDKTEIGHGYGLKSIRYITEAYNGQMSIKRDGQEFLLLLIFPQAE